MPLHIQKKNMLLSKRAVRVLVVSAILVCCIATVLSCFYARNMIREQWYLCRLSSADRDVSQAAIRALGALKSKKAVPLLINGLREAVSAKVDVEERVRPFCWSLSQIGRIALPELFVALCDSDPIVCGYIFLTILRVYESEPVAGIEVTENDFDLFHDASVFIRMVAKAERDEKICEAAKSVLACLTKE